MITINLLYFALFREVTGKGQESLSGEFKSPEDVFKSLGDLYTLDIDKGILQVAVNDSFAGWDTALVEGDTVVFIMPVSGG